MDHLYHLPVMTAAGAGYGAFLYHLATNRARKTRFGWLRPVLWGAGLGTVGGVAMCMPVLRCFAWVVLVDHSGWIDVVVFAIGVAVLPGLVVQIRRWERDHPERTRRP
ncbi:hypothetical protein [Kitasatospora sp. NPDC096204]|uniref:hypothetical protein n=1 Tax=Kitasatospora sp. NPDC096204 TaxID=3364094 RepID=UPI0037FA64B9